MEYSHSIAVKAARTTLHALPIGIEFESIQCPDCGNRTWVPIQPGTLVSKQLELANDLHFLIAVRNSSRNRNRTGGCDLPNESVAAIGDIEVATSVCGDSRKQATHVGIHCNRAYRPGSNSSYP